MSWCYLSSMRLATPRANALPEIHGEALVRLLLDEIDEEERLGTALGIDLTPPGPAPSHAPPVYPALDEWLRRSEEVHAFLEARYREERRAAGR
jgi:hypothetical protein